MNGVGYALLAFGSWGLIPIYWKALKHVPSDQVLAHRCVWSLPVLAVLLVAGRRLSEVGRALADLRHLRLLLASAALLTFNWGVFLWAMAHDRVLESSLGYYVNPLVNVALGVVVLRERLRPLQGWAVGIATLAVVLLTLASGAAPWVALALAFSFGLYGLLRKLAGVDALAGLAVETLMVAPFALAWLVHEARAGRGAFPGDAATTWLLVGTGLVSSVPLLWFAHAARRLGYATLGQFQYVTPTGHLLLGWLVYGEPLTEPRAVAFALIAVALALYAYDTLRSARTRAPA